MANATNKIQAWRPGTTQRRPGSRVTADWARGRYLCAVDPVDGRSRIYAPTVTASVRPVMLVEDALQPALRWGWQRLSFAIYAGINGVRHYVMDTAMRLRFTNTTGCLPV
jgi:hypothetical protein